MFYKTFQKLILTFILLTFTDVKASQIDEARVAQLGHSFERIASYKAVQDTADALLAQGVLPDEITVLTDWDNVINTLGAWEQRHHDGRYVCDVTKRITREHEVDDKLRDEHILTTHESLKQKGIHVIVVTARPPIHDEELPIAVGEEAVLDLRHPQNPDKIHYEGIHGHVKRTLSEMPEDQIIAASSRKISKMQNQSRVSLTGQKGLNKSFVRDIDGFKRVYHDGFAFVGHDKGPAVMPIYAQLDKKPKYTIIIDDSPIALNSYIQVLDQIQGKVYFLYFPKPGK